MDDLEKGLIVMSRRHATIRDKSLSQRQALTALRVELDTGRQYFTDRILVGNRPSVEDLEVVLQEDNRVGKATEVIVELRKRWHKQRSLWERAWAVRKTGGYWIYLRRRGRVVCAGSCFLI